MAVEAPTRLGRMMFMPGGLHTITAGYAQDSSAQITIKIDRETAAVLNASLAAANAKHAPQRALFDREHEGKEAMAWPEAFEWSESPSPGIYATAEYSSLGREFVEGKVFRSFSPQFFADADLPKAGAVRAGQRYAPGTGKRGSAENPARITGLDFPFAGTFTNDPAFRKILPLWAKNAGAPSGPKSHQPHTSHPSLNQMIADKKAALQADIEKLETQIETLKASQAADPADAETATALLARNQELADAKRELEKESLQARNQELEQALLGQRTKDAKDAVKAAVKRGAIPAKDEALQANWEKKLIEDPDNLVLLASVPGHPALDRALAPQKLTLNRVQIVKEDAGVVLKAYSMEKDPRKKAAIYARELSKRIAEGEDLPIYAANTLGTLAGEIIVQRALELLTLNLPLLSRIGTDFSDQSVAFNTELNTRIIGIPGTSAYHTTNGYATENTLTTDVPVTIDGHRSSQVSFNANELASTSRRLFDEFAPAMQYAIGKMLVDAVYGEITVAQFAQESTVEALVDFDRQTVITLGGVLSDAGVPDMGRTLLLNGSYFDKLFSDSAIVSLAAQQNAGVITEGQMVRVHGFDVIRASNLPTAENLTGFAFSKSALVLATRLPNDYSAALPGATGGGVVQVITEPRTGVSLMLTQFVNHLLGASYARVAIMYGTAPGQALAGQRLTSAADA
jgi:hypothetical protein